jgi:peroxiredoxin
MICLSARTHGLIHRRALTAFLCVLCVLCVFVVQAPPGSANAPGSPAPGFVLPDIYGRQVRLNDYRGQVVVLNFWAFWCDTWKAEMPHLQELIARQEELGFRLVAVTVDGTRLPEFRKRAGSGKPPFPILLDVDGQVSARYKVTHVPTVVIIDRAERIRYTAAGYPGNHVVMRELRKLASTGVRQLQPVPPTSSGCSDAKVAQWRASGYDLSDGD